MEGVYYKVDLVADAEPVNRQAFKMSPAHKEELEHQLKKLLDTGVIHESTGSLWGVPSFLVFKKDEQGNSIKPRLVVDSQHTNKMIVDVTAHMPKVDEIIDHIVAGTNKVENKVILRNLNSCKNLLMS